MNRIANPHTQRSRIANAAELGDLEIPMIPMGNSEHITIRPLTTNELSPEELEAFLTVEFSNHYEILAHAKEFQQRLFYIGRCATGFGAVRNCCITLAKTCILKKGPCPTILL